MARLSSSLLEKGKMPKSKPGAETRNNLPAGPTPPDASKALKRKKEGEPVVEEAGQPSPKNLKKPKQDGRKLPIARKSSKGKKEEKIAVVEEVIEVEQGKKKAPKQKKRTELPIKETTETARTTANSKEAKKSAADSDPPTIDPPFTKSKPSKKSELPAPALPSISRSRKPETSKPKKVKTPPPEPSSGEEDDIEASVAGEGSDEEDEDEGLLHGFSTDEDSSDEEDAMDDDAGPLDIGKLPTVAKDDLSVKRKLEKAKRQPTEDRGVLYLGRLPHGFFEDQMKAYFSQFGNVTRLRLSRNKKSGKSKHYGFIEFDSSSVAQIVADTMDNYLIMGHILRCKVVPKHQAHPELWVGANRKWRVVPSDRLARTQHNKPRTEDQQRQAARRLLKRQGERKRKLAALGIKYDVDAVSYKRLKKAE